jgi:hypothetical protein
MRTLIRLAIAFINLVLWAMVGAALCVMCSCARVQYVPVENYQKDSIYIKQYERDSVYFKDSVFVHTKADTVFLTRTQFKYREIILRDTMHVLQCDTTTVVQEVERDFTPWESICFSLGRVMLTIGAFVLIYKLYILFRKLRK